MRRWRGNPWAVLSILCLGFFMTLLDLTIVNIAIPDMVDRLDASLDDILWVVNAYTLGLAVLMITAGRLGDLWGKKTMFMAGVAVFTVASLACGLAQSPAQLIAFRAVQGIGAALLLPQTLSIIVDIFPPEKRGAALGAWGAVAGVSGAAGPTLGGLLVDQLDWRWIFFVNIPIGILVLLAAVPILPERRRGVRHRLDLTGVLIATVMLFCLTFGLIEGERYNWDSRIWALLAAAAVLLVVLLLHQRTQQDNEPLLPFSLFRDRNFSVVNFIGIAVSFGVVGMLLPLTIYLQSVLGFSALKAGLSILPLSAGTILMAGPAGILSERLGSKYILMAGLSAFAGGLLWIIVAVDVGKSWTVVAGPLFLIGLGAGCTFAPMAAEVMRNVPGRLTGAASGVNNALRQVGSVLAAAVIGAVLQSRLAGALAEQAEQRSGALPEPYRGQFVTGFARAGEQGLAVGSSQPEAQVPTGVPAEIALRIQDLAGQVFGHGFIDAMKPAIGVAAAVMIIGALACLLIQSPGGPSANPLGLPLSDEELEAENMAAAH